MNKLRMLFFGFFILISGRELFANAPKLKVYFFFSESCPICQSVTIEIKKLFYSYHKMGFEFYGIFPNQSLSNKKTREDFGRKYELTFPLVGDSMQKLTTQFNAEITPEVVVWDNEKQIIIYRGKIDNSFEAIGKRRTIVTEHYLQKAFENWLNGKSELNKNTEPVGCFIQKQIK